MWAETPTALKRYRHLFLRDNGIISRRRRGVLIVFADFQKSLRAAGVRQTAGQTIA